MCHAAKSLSFNKPTVQTRKKMNIKLEITLLEVIIPLSNMTSRPRAEIIEPMERDLSVWIDACVRNTKSTTSVTSENKKEKL
ncbi:hypothetical protein TNIN_357381 [Trichonephila inaurata madagascariensis]|uniref:Uncharacterized protein n=1 Tax=Trichonephila inaurata madagascariensis TaxID=2747483 RepID=A0A8X7CJH1_9ARAC|nr:hypothetical protein TNIN_357381 [Trichonephila inaurata madagascariensis]